MTSKKNIVYRPSRFDSRRRSDAEAARLLFKEEKLILLELLEKYMLE